MSCYTPIPAFMPIELNKEGKRPIFWSSPKGIDYKCISVACGKCDGCKLDIAREWAARCVHEAKMYNDNCVITLTYNDEYLEKNNPEWNLVKKDFQDFIKRLRFYISPLVYASCCRSSFNRLKVDKIFTGGSVRYFYCGEYGDIHNRPHFHACLFGFDFKDKILYKNDKGTRLYRSAILEDLWQFGYSAVGDLNDASASYIARYCVKKVLSNDDLDDNKVKEFTGMSRRPGIGSNFISSYFSDIYPDDYVIMSGGLKIKPPRFYDDKYLLTNESEMVYLKAKRIKEAKRSINNTPYHLKARARIQEARTKLFSKRGL